ncbi:MAG: Organic solvent tolerance protein [Desulfonauticus sp. 38_4375]|nr:MAG: Organic solvent tolerance protein [Desulfonauticus sp. 38_4375]
MFRRCLGLLLLIFFSYLATANGEELPWHLEADKLYASEKGGYIEGFGRVMLTRGKDYLFADYIRYYKDTNWAYLKGKIKIKWQDDYLEGEEAEFNLKDKVGWVKKGKIFISPEHIYIYGDYLEKKGQNIYKFEEATLTSCDGTHPAWSLSTKSGEITLEGYAKLWHPKFRIKNTPVLYSPFLLVPAKTKRQSGLLIPEIGSSSKKGFNYNQPYYQVINAEQDLTLFENYYSLKGIMRGLEYRFTPNVQTKGLLRGDYLYDSKIATTENDEESEFQDDGLIRPNHDRYWLRGKIDSFLFDPEWKLKLDLDYVSDQNYLREFKTGLSGFNQSRTNFLNEFGRDIEETDDLTRTNTLSLFHSFENFSLTGKVVYTENLNYKNHNLPASKDPTVQRLPELDLSFYKTPLPYLGLDVEGNLNTVYFWREYGTKGERIDIYPKISKTFKLWHTTIIPKLGFRETLYLIDRFENESTLIDQNSHIQARNIYDFNLDTYTELFKVYDLQDSPLTEGENHYSKLKHNLKPEITYSFRPEKDQRELPYFDSVDRLGPEEELTYSLTNLFTLRKDTLSNGTLQKEYLDFLRLKLEQSYNFREARRNNDLEEYPRRPFSDLLLEANLNFNSYLSYTGNTYYSFYLKKITEHEHTLRLTYPEKLSGFFSLDFEREIDEYTRKRTEEVKILKWGGDILFIPRWKISLLFRHDLVADRDLEKTLILTYLHQCFSLEFTFSRTDYEDRFQVMVNLLNLGSFGGK